MWRTIARMEMQMALREKILYPLVFLLGLLILASALVGYAAYRSYQGDSEQARRTFRKEWIEQQANPHSAAHFGTYLFKPVTPMSLYDPGLTAYLGTTYRVEAHYQHLMTWAPALDSGDELRLGELTVARIFQLLVPLLIILLGFASVSREKEQHTLRLLISQGVSPTHLLWGKIAGTYCLLLVLLLPLLLLLTLGLLLGPVSESVGARFGLWAIIYLLFFFILTVWVCLVSAWSRRSSFSLLISLAGWIILGVLLPRAAIHMTDLHYSLPSRYALNKQMEDSYAKGLEKDSSRSERLRVYEQKILTQYGVDSLQNLPLNFDGLAMQLSEDYQSKVFKKHLGELNSTFSHQQSMYELATFLDPFVMVQQLSMVLAGTDLYHHNHFHEAAKSYRDAFIRTLNLDMAYGGSAYLTYDYQVGPEFFGKMQEFHYEVPPVGLALQKHGAAGAALLMGLLLPVLLVNPVSKRLLR